MSTTAPIVKVRPRVTATELQFWWSPPAQYWVAVGANTGNTVCISKSTDGVSWVSATNNPFSGGQGQGTAWNGSYWVAVGSNGASTVTIAKSTDGMTWTDSSSGGNNPFTGGVGRGIAWNGSYWIAVGQNTGDTVCIAKSSDGMTWTDASNNPFTGGASLGIAWNGSYWVAVGYNTDSSVCIAKSTDGMTWTDSSGGGGNNPFTGGSGGLGIAWNGSYWVAVGNNTDYTVCIAKSPDGLTWTDASNNPFTGGYGFDIAWNGSYWIAVGQKAESAVCIAKSPDGMTWTDASNNPFSGGQGRGIAWNGTYWVAAGVNTDNTITVVKSPDGMTWTSSSGAGGNNPFTGGYSNGIAYNNINLKNYILESASPALSYTVGPTVTTKTVTGLTNLTDYSFTIKTDLSGSYSASQAFRTVRTSNRPQPVATLTKAESIVNGELDVTFSWTNPGDYATYYVYGLKAAAGTQNTIYAGTSAYSTLSKSFTGLDPARAYIFSVQRGNDAGYSTATSITTTITLFDPTTVTGLNFWVDAADVSGNGATVVDGATVGTWKDKSGTNHSATATTGAVLRTDTVGRYLDFQGSTWYDLSGSSWAYNQYYTIFIVDKPRGYNYQYSLMGRQSASTDSFYIQYNTSDGIRLSSQGDNAAFGTAFESVTAPVNIWCFTNYGGKTVYWNKLVSGKNPVTPAYITDSLLSIGAKQGGSEPYYGRMREILIYTGVMSETNRGAIQTYLYNKWFTQPVLIPLIPVENSAVMWLDGADITTFFQDVPGTVPVTASGQTVRVWKDKSGFDNHMFALTGATYEGSQAFNTGTSTYISTYANNLHTGDASLFLVLVGGGSDTSDGYFIHDISGNFGLRINGALGISWSASTTKNNNMFTREGSTFIFYGTMKKGQLTKATYIDLTGLSINTSYAIDTLNLIVGTAPAKLSSGRGAQYGEVIYYNRVLTDAEIQQNATYLSNKWGIPIPTTSAFVPTALTGLKVWLDSSDPSTLLQSGGVVTAWNDRSGNGNNAVPYGSPTVNNGVVFNGSSQWLSLPNGALPTEDYSYYAVSKFTGDSVIVSGGSKDISGQLWVAAGYNSARTVSISISEDGLTWVSAIDNPFSGSGGFGQGIAWNGSYWIAVGNNSSYTVTIAKSTNARTWANASNNPFPGGSASGVAWNGSYWVAVGTNTGYTVCIAKSPDGMTWTDASNNPFSGGTGKGIAWNGSYWIAVGTNEGQTICIAKSLDGMTWTSSSGGGGNNPFILALGIAWNGSYWVAVGQSSTSVSIAKSPNGINWTDASNNPFSYGRAIAWNGSYWVAGGNNYGSTVTIAKSSDGMTWTDASNNPFPGGYTQGISWNGSYWVAVGQGSTNTVSIAKSSDGMTWTSSSGGGGNNPFPGGESTAIAIGIGSLPNKITTIKAVTSDLYLYVGGGNGNNYICYSYDGINWLVSTNGNAIFTTSCYAVAYGGSKWVAGGTGTNTLAYSTDGITWTASTSGNSVFTTSCIAVAYGGSIWVAGGSGTNQLAYSADGITWIPDISGNAIFTATCNAVAYGGGKWLAGGSGATNKLAYSADGINWTASTSGNDILTSSCRAIVYGGGKWVAGGSGTSCLAYSADGESWTTSPNSAAFSQCNTVAYGAGKWVAGGQGSNRLVYSTDGITWLASTSGNSVFTENCRTVNYSGQRWVAGGGGGGSQVAYSTDGITWTTSTSGNSVFTSYCYALASQNLGSSRRGQTVFDNDISGAPNKSILTDYNLIPGTTTVIIESLYDGGKSLYLSGITGATDTSTHLQDSANNLIGKDLSGNYMNGTIKELLVYNVKHTTTQRQQVEAYLKAKWYPNAYAPTGTALWLDASGSTNFTLSGTNIQSWNDKSASANNFTQSAVWAQPIYSLDSVTGRYGVQFAANAIANGLTSATSPFGATSSWSVFAVQRYDYSTNQSSELVNGKVCTLYDISGNTPIAFNIGTTNVATPSISELRFTADLSGSNTTVEIHTKPVLTSQVVNSLTYTAYYNGSTSVTHPVSQAMTTAAKLNIGYTGTLTPALAGAMRGYVYELIVFKITVNTATRQSVEGYLAWKWGIQNSLPTTHPYYLAPP